MSDKKKHIIFDLDGTIIDSRDEILKTYLTVFKEIQPEKQPEVSSLNFGLTLNDLLKSVYGNDSDKIKDARRSFISIYDSSQYNETHLYRDVYDILLTLKNRGYELYIATNKRLLPTMKILEAKKIKHLFSHIMTNEMQVGVTLSKQEMISSLKQKGSFSEGYMVGDSISDIQAGQDEKLLTIAVNYGYEREEVLRALSPTFSANNFQDLYTFVLSREDK